MIMKMFSLLPPRFHLWWIKKINIVVEALINGHCEHLGCSASAVQCEFTSKNSSSQTVNIAGLQILLPVSDQVFNGKIK